MTYEVKKVGSEKSDGSKKSKKSKEGKKGKEENRLSRILATTIGPAGLKHTVACEGGCPAVVYSNKELFLR